MHTHTEILCRAHARPSSIRTLVRMRERNVLDRASSSLTFGLSLDPTETLVVSANVCFVFEY